MPNPIPRARADGTVAYKVPYRVTRAGRVVQTSATFDTLDAARRWARLLERVGPEAAVEVLRAHTVRDAPII
jgi:hypothetical protein